MPLYSLHTGAYCQFFLKIRVKCQNLPKSSPQKRSRRLPIFFAEYIIIIINKKIIIIFFIKNWYYSNFFTNKKNYYKLVREVLVLFMWGQRIYSPGPFHIKAQDLRQGEIMPRTHHRSPKRPKEMAEDDLVLSIP